jgi:hypothetical protein
LTAGKRRSWKFITKDGKKNELRISNMGKL